MMDIMRKILKKYALPSFQRSRKMVNASILLDRSKKCSQRECRDESY